MAKKFIVDLGSFIFFRISQTYYLDGMSREQTGSQKASVELSVYSIEPAGHLDG